MTFRRERCAIPSPCGICKIEYFRSPAIGINSVLPCRENALFGGFDFDRSFARNQAFKFGGDFGEQGLKFHIPNLTCCAGANAHDDGGESAPPKSRHGISFEAIFRSIFAELAKHGKSLAQMQCPGEHGAQHGAVN